MGPLSPLHWLIVLGVVVVLFSAKRLPDMARSVGQSAQVLRGELQGLTEDATPALARQETAVLATPATVPTQRAETSAERAGAGQSG